MLATILVFFWCLYMSMLWFYKMMNRQPLTLTRTTLEWVSFNCKEGCKMEAAAPCCRDVMFLVWKNLIYIGCLRLQHHRNRISSFLYRFFDNRIPAVGPIRLHCRASLLTNLEIRSEIKAEKQVVCQADQKFSSWTNRSVLLLMEELLHHLGSIKPIQTQ